MIIGLDLGCGSQKRKGYIGLDLFPNRDLDIIGDAHNLPIRHNVIGLIISSKVFEHLNNPFKCVIECKRVLTKQWGFLVLGIPNIHTLRRFLRWAIKGKITVGEEHIYCWGLPEIINLVESQGFMCIDYYLDTYDRYHKIGFIERVIRRFNKRIVDKNLNLVFLKELTGDIDR